MSLPRIVDLNGSARRLILLSLAGVLYLAALGGALGGQEPSKGLSRDQVLKLLHGDVPPARVRYLINLYGIAFPMTPETENVAERSGRQPRTDRLGAQAGAAPSGRGAAPGADCPFPSRADSSTPSLGRRKFTLTMSVTA